MPIEECVQGSMFSNDCVITAAYKGEHAPIKASERQQ
jgi:hypothetical protein